MKPNPLCPRTLRSVARRLQRSANSRESMYPPRAVPGSLYCRLLEAREWAGMLNREARRLEKAKAPK